MMLPSSPKISANSSREIDSNGIILMDIDGQGIVADDEFLRFQMAIVPELLDFLFFDAAAGVGHVAIAVDQAGDAES